MSRILEAAAALKAAADAYDALPVEVRAKPGFMFSDPLTGPAMRREFERLTSIAEAASSEPPTPQQPEGCTTLTDCGGTRWALHGDAWRRIHDGHYASWPQLVEYWAPLTPLLPGEPIGGTS